MFETQSHRPLWYGVLIAWYCVSNVGLTPSSIERIIGIQMNRFTARSQKFVCNTAQRPSSLYKVHHRTPLLLAVGVWAFGGITSLSIFPLCYHYYPW